MTTIKAIETRYAGCRFRSRLEARWAVFFDDLDIRWLYEPQGFSLPSGPYLPDFLLPDGEAWIEIKGEEPASADLVKLREFAHSMSVQGQRVRILQGEIPRVPASFHGVDTIRAYSLVPGYLPISSLSDGMLTEYANVPPEYWVAKPSYWLPGSDGDLRRALDAARSARFEHGQQG